MSVRGEEQVAHTDTDTSMQRKGARVEEGLLTALCEDAYDGVAVGIWQLVVGLGWLELGGVEHQEAAHVGVGHLHRMQGKSG